MIMPSLKKEAKLIDYFGAFFALMGLFYIFFGERISGIEYGDEIASILANISTEGVGIWITVKIIDQIIRAGDKKNLFRLTIVRQSRYLVRISKIANAQKREIDIDLVKTELKNAMARLQRCKDRLDFAEISAVKNFHESIDEFMGEVESKRKQISEAKTVMDRQLAELDLSAVSIFLLRKIYL